MPASTINEEKNLKGHVFYFEPNFAEEYAIDSYDLADDTKKDKKVIPLMPHVEDMCIAMALTADIYPRTTQPISGESKDKDGNVSHITLAFMNHINMNDINKGASQIVNSGDTFGEEKYLTTYYTEISSEKYIENEIIEGFGVTSVNVAFESWYTPTITIKFVDVRGSSLFGREEAIHDSFGKITKENILGVFFTQPYPIFRLQIKGLVGKAVTYQLAVSNMKSNYNAKTGNFEVTVTFIGYSYSLLTDIPISYISSVSEMSYAGKKYWDEHCNTREWALSDGSAPPKLYEVLTRIKSHLSTIRRSNNGEEDCDDESPTNSSANADVTNAAEQDMVSQDQSLAIANSEAGLNQLNKVTKNLSDFMRTVSQGCNVIGWNNGFTADGEVLVTYPLLNSVNLSFAKTKYTALKNSVNEILGSKVKITKGGILEDAYDKKNGVLQTTKYFSIFNNMIQPNALGGAFAGGNAWAMGNQSTYPNLNVFRNQPQAVKGTIDGDVRTQKLKGEITKTIETFNAKRQSQPYGYIQPPLDENGVILDFSELIEAIGKKYKEFRSKKDTVSNKIENTVAEAMSENDTVPTDLPSTPNTKQVQTIHIKDLIGFTPTIGDFVKVVMCHLETFVHVMMTCADDIVQNPNTRKVSDILKGRSLSQTDIVVTEKNAADIVVPPWPALYGKTRNPRTEKQSDERDTMHWMGDVCKEAVECDVVNSLKNAIRTFVDTARNVENASNSTFSAFPVSAVDLTDTVSPFHKVAGSCNSTPNIAPYLGLRMAQLIGIGDKNISADMAKNLGSVDAMNFFMSNGAPYMIKDVIAPQGQVKKFDDAILGILTCSPDCDDYALGKEGNPSEKYYRFERAKKTVYSKQGRHPMFVKEGDKYVYSYMYADKADRKTCVPIVPRKLEDMNGSIYPYLGDLTIKDDNGYAYYVPNVKESDGGQAFVTNTKTASCGFLTEHKDSKKYLNDNQFQLITSDSLVNSIINKEKELVEGKVGIYKYATENDEAMKKFAERYYSTSFSQYKKYYGGTMLFGEPLSSTDKDYAKYLYLDQNKKDTLMGVQWLDKRKYKRASLGDDYGSYTANNSDVSLDRCQVFIPTLLHRTSRTDKGTQGSLFGSTLYYIQNETNNSEKNKRQRDYRKAFLLLQSMAYTAKLNPPKVFSDTTHATIEVIPKWYALLIGSLLWYYEECESMKTNSANTWNFPKRNQTFLRNENGNYRFCMRNKGDDYNTSDSITFKQIAGMNSEEMDIVVKNRLISVFKTWCAQEFPDIRNSLELKSNGGNVFTSTWKELVIDNLKEQVKVEEVVKEYCLEDFYGKYESIAKPKNGTMAVLVISESNPANGLLAHLYTDKWIVSRSTSVPYGSKADRAEISIPSSVMHAYLNGFSDRLQSIVNNEIQTDAIDMVETNTVEDEYDITVEMYYTLKHLWDAWLLKARKDQFTIKNFFNKYFVFIDSFYQNVYKDIALNAEHIYDAYQNENANIVTFIDYVTSKAGCMFAALPDFMDHNNLTIESMENHNANLMCNIKNMRSIFTPCPYNEMNKIEPNNTFVFMYVHKPSSIVGESTGYANESYDISDVLSDSPDNTLPNTLTRAPFSLDMATTGEQVGADEASVVNYQEPFVMSRYAYTMPSFGIAVNSMHNYLFRNIGLNMDSPMVTSISAKTYEDILNRGGNDVAKKIYFHGQDIYNIYSQFSYQCAVEMMGCAQIQPLMYFQLLNMPMWRGTYMIYKVTHTMTPGFMLTNFVGMKMSRTQMPFASSYYSVGKNQQKSSGGNNGVINSVITLNGDNFKNADLTLFQQENCLNSEIIEAARPYYLQYMPKGQTHYVAGDWRCSTFVSYVLQDVKYLTSPLTANALYKYYTGQGSARAKEIFPKKNEKLLPGDIMSIYRPDEPHGHAAIIWTVKDDGSPREVISAGTTGHENQVIVKDYGVRDKDKSRVHFFRILKG